MDDKIPRKAPQTQLARQIQQAAGYYQNQSEYKNKPAEFLHLNPPLPVLFLVPVALSSLLLFVGPDLLQLTFSSARHLTPLTGSVVI